MGSTQRKANTATQRTDINEKVISLIEERNMLIYTISNCDIIQIEAISGWSLEALHQLLLANHKKAEIERKASEKQKK